MKRDRVFEVLGRLRSKEVPLEMWGMWASDLQDRIWGGFPQVGYGAETPPEGLHCLLSPGRF